MKINTSIDLKTLSEKLNAKLTGDYNTKISLTGIMPLEDAENSDISFISSDKFIKKLQNTKAACVICPFDMNFPGKTLLKVESVWTAVIEMLNFFYPPETSDGTIHPTAIIAPSAETGENVSIGAYSVIEENTTISDNSIIGAQCFIGKNVRIGKSVVIKPHVTIFQDTIIGNNVIIHAGTVLGSDGFRYESVRGIPVKIPQVGKVVIEDDVEIGTNCCVDRAFIKETRIRRGVKLDNLVQVAHNVDIGDYTIIVAQCGIAGSTRIGRGCLFGGQVGVGDHLTIGDNVQLGGQSGIIKNIKDGERLFGYPAYNIRDFMKNEAVLRKLPELLKKHKEEIKQLKKAIDTLSESGKNQEKSD